MIPILTSAEIKKIDRAAAENNIENGFQYMQTAARSLFDLIINKYLDFQKQEQDIFISIFAGKGNNGGDGILLAAYLAQEGYPVKCFIVGSSAQLENEAKLAYQKLSALNINNEYVIFINDVDDLHFIAKHFEDINTNYHQHFLVDALLGIGSKGNLREPFSSIIDFINLHSSHQLSNTTVFAIDLPSGSDADSGEYLGPCIRAHTTVSMGFPKLGSFFFPARANYGLTIVNNLGYPEETIKANIDSNIFFVNSVTGLMPPRITDGSKYNHGVGVLVAGSEGMSGAAILAAKAAYRTGLGLTHLVSNDSTISAASINIPEAVSHLDQNKTDIFTKLIESNPNSVLAIGPGLSTRRNLALKLLDKIERPIVLDADGINAFSGRTKLLKNHKSDLLITPHAGEYRRLFPNLPENIKALELIKNLEDNAREYSMTVLYKGSPTIIADPNGKVFIVPFGNSALAKAGTGDVLTGIILGLAAQIYTIKSKFTEMNFFYEESGVSALTQAAIVGAYLHGKAGELAANDLGEYSLLASDLIDYLPQSIRGL